MPAATPPDKAEKPRSKVVGKRVWTAGRLLVLAGALTLTYAVFFLAAMRIASQAREVAVPDLRGQSVADATALVARAGFTLKVDPIRRADPKVPADHVLSQDPDAGFMLRRDRSVRVKISEGVKDAEIPSVIGQTERTAEITLAQNHVGVAGRAEMQTTSYPPDTIVAQDPPARGRGPSVTILVNHGGAGLTYVMPDLILTYGNQVAQILRARNFRVAITSQSPYPGVAPGLVINQTPKAGFQIAPGEAISLEVSR